MLQYRPFAAVFSKGQRKEEEPLERILARATGDPEDGARPVDNERNPVDIKQRVAGEPPITVVSA